MIVIHSFFIGGAVILLRCLFNLFELNLCDCETVLKYFDVDESSELKQIISLKYYTLAYSVLICTCAVHFEHRTLKGVQKCTDFRQTYIKL